MGQKSGTKMAPKGKWNQRLKHAVCPSSLISSHTHFKRGAKGNPCKRVPPKKIGGCLLMAKGNQTETPPIVALDAFPAHGPAFLRAFRPQRHSGPWPGPGEKNLGAASSARRKERGVLEGEPGKKPTVPWGERHNLWGFKTIFGGRKDEKLPAGGGVFKPVFGRCLFGPNIEMPVSRVLRESAGNQMETNWTSYHFWFHQSSFLIGNRHCHLLFTNGRPLLRLSPHLCPTNTVESPTPGDSRWRIERALGTVPKGTT